VHHEVLDEHYLYSGRGFQLGAEYVCDQNLIDLVLYAWVRWTRRLLASGYGIFKQKQSLSSRELPMNFWYADNDTKGESEVN